MTKHKELTELIARNAQALADGSITPKVLATLIMNQHPRIGTTPKVTYGTISKEILLVELDEQDAIVEKQVVTNDVLGSVGVWTGHLYGGHVRGEFADFYVEIRAQVKEQA